MKNYYKLVMMLAAILFAGQLNAQTVFSYTGAMETYTVPAGVTLISIEAIGAAGGENTGGTGGTYGIAGLGASMSGEFVVTPGQVLNIVVGEQPPGGNFVGGGGGGSFVWDDASSTLMMAAGGGGGAGYSVSQDGLDASTGEDGVNGNGMSDGAGVGGNGGTAPSDPDIASGGAGWLTNGSNGTVYSCTSNSLGGETALSGAAGGTGGGSGTSIGIGGYGGGGGGNARCGAVGGGGGGGYSGGGAGGEPGGGYHGAGGGGSYNGGSAQVNTAGVGTGHGEITITDLCSGLITTVSDDTVCLGDEVTLSAASSGTGVVTWDGGVVDGVPFTPPAGSTTYTATSDDPGDCEFSVTIFVGDLPTVDAGTDVNFCPGDSVMLTASGTATDWSWDGGITDGVNFLPASGTTAFTLTGTIDSTGCMSTDMVDVIEVIIDNTISVIGSDLMANQGGATYQWLECPAFTIVAGETAQTYASTPEGDFAVEITLDGCVDTSACQVVHLGIDGVNGLDLDVYPNPTTDNVQIQLQATFTYVIADISGKVIMSGIGTNKEMVSLSDLADGAYFLTVKSAGAEETVKLVKQ